MSWHGDRGLCDTTDLSKCTATAASSGGSEDVFQQHLLSLLADFKPCHAGETTPGTGTTVSGGTSENPGQGGNGTTPKNPGDNGGSTTTERSYHPPSNTTDGGSSTGNPGGNPTTPTNPGQGGNGSTPNPGPGDGGSTPMPTTVPLPTCPACPIPTEKPCPVAEECPACPTQVSHSCPAAPTCPPPVPAPTCKACPATAACPAVPTCPPPPKCDSCPVPTEKVCPTASPCPTPPKKPICDDGWKYLNVTNSCYFMGIKDLTNMDAIKECIAQDSQLASIHSDDENAFIYNMAAVANKNPMFNPWIGHYRTGPGATDFANNDGTPVDYTRYGVNQINNIDGNEFCTEMRVRYTGTTKSLETRWNDFNCALTRPVFVCKKPANT